MLNTVNPFPGLRPFLKQEKRFFCGRDDHRDEMLAILHKTHFLAVIGPSGCGKSSLVRAGLLPDLESGLMGTTGARWSFIEMRPQNRPMRQLQKSLDDFFKKNSPKSDLEGDTSFFKRTFQASSLARLLAQAPVPKNTNFLLLVDQFEEIFRFRNLTNRNELLKLEDEARDFVKLLIELRDCSEFPIYIVITMRTDYLEDCALFENLPEVINQSQFLTPRMNVPQLERAIEEPPRRLGGKVEPELTQYLVNTTAREPEQLPLMQHLLMRIWSKAAKGKIPRKDEIILTKTICDQAGGIENALSNHADEALKEAELAGLGKVAEALFKCLGTRSTGKKDTRNPTSVKDVAAVAGVDEEEVKQVADIFRHPKYGFIYPPPKDLQTDDPIPLASDTKLDVCHESLLRQWKKAREWIGDEQKKAQYFSELGAQATRWQADRRAKLQGVSLEWALEWWKDKAPTEEWAKRYGDGFQIVANFLTASKKAAQQRERSMLLAKVAAVLVLMALSIAYIVISSSKQLEHRRAEFEYTRAEELRASDVSLFASTVRATNQPFAALLALDGLAMAKQSKHYDAQRDRQIWMARLVLNEVIKGCPPPIFFEETDTVGKIVFGHRTPTLYISTGNFLKKVDPVIEDSTNLPPFLGIPRLMSVSAEETRVAGYYPFDGLIKIWPLTSTNLSKLAVTNEPRAIALNSKGDKLYVLGLDGTFTVWTGAGFSSRVRINFLTNSIDSALFSPSAERLLTVTLPYLTIYRVESNAVKPMYTADVNSQDLRRDIPATFCPGNQDCLFLASGDSFSEINYASNSVVARMDTHFSNGAYITYLAVSDSGGRQAVMYSDGLLRIFNLSPSNTFELMYTLAGGQIPRIQGFDMSSDGRYVAVSSINQGIMWDLNIMKEIETDRLDSLSLSVLFCSGTYSSNEISQVSVKTETTSRLRAARLEAIGGHYDAAFAKLEKVAPDVGEDPTAVASNWLGLALYERVSRIVNRESALHSSDAGSNDTEHQNKIKKMLSDARNKAPANFSNLFAYLEGGIQVIESGKNSLTNANSVRATEFIEIGNKQAFSGRLQSAIASYKEAIKLDPRLSIQLDPTNEAYRKVNTNIADALRFIREGNALAERDTNAAIQKFQEAIKLNPDLTNGANGLNPADEAQRIWSSSEALQMIKQGNDFARDHKAKEAAEKYRAAIRLDPSLTNSLDPDTEAKKFASGLNQQAP